jgi:putative ABC transport system permease protein
MRKIFWPERSPIGARVQLPGPDRPWFTVVGVVADVRQNGLDQPTGTEIYFLQDQMPVRTVYLLVSSPHAPAGLATSVRGVVRQLDPTLPTAEFRSLEQVMLDSVAQPRLLMVLLLVFSVVTLTLAAVGTYSVLAYSVARRTREVGVRMALGARAGQILGMVLRQGAGLAGLGLFLGLVGALALRRLLATLLFGVSPADPLIFAVVSSLLGLVACVACYLPARRAARVDPLISLRHE